MVEHLLPKQRVASSTLVSRSNPQHLMVEASDRANSPLAYSNSAGATSSAQAGSGGIGPHPEVALQPAWEATIETIFGPRLLCREHAADRPRVFDTRPHSKGAKRLPVGPCEPASRIACQGRPTMPQAISAARAEIAINRRGSGKGLPLPMLPILPDKECPLRNHHPIAW